LGIKIQLFLFEKGYKVTNLGRRKKIEKNKRENEGDDVLLKRYELTITI
jgi:hypothetical protein